LSPSEVQAGEQHNTTERLGYRLPNAVDCGDSVGLGELAMRGRHLAQRKPPPEESSRNHNESHGRHWPELSRWSLHPHPD
jgi:hypothetical protein